MADPGGGATEELEWQFLQCFGQPTENEEIQEGPLFSACESSLEQWPVSWPCEGLSEATLGTQRTTRPMDPRCPPCALHSQRS